MSLSNPLKYIIIALALCFCLFILGQKMFFSPYPPLNIATVKLTIEKTINSSKKIRSSIEISSENSDLFNGICGIELHGKSTLLASKKSYDIEFRDELKNDKTEQVLDFLPGEDFILLANPYDKTFTRNALAFKLWQKLGHYVPKYHYCELYINDDYQGLYMMIEEIKVHKNRLDLNADSSSKDRGLNAPFLIKQDWGYNNIPAPSTSVTGDYLSYKCLYPKSKNIKWSERGKIVTFLKEIEVSFHDILKEEKEGKPYEELIDLNSFVDLFIVNELSKNPDGFKASTYFHRKLIEGNSEESKKLRIGPIWDFDLAFSNVQFEHFGEPIGWGFLETGDSSHINRMSSWWNLLACDLTFKERCKERLVELNQLFSIADCHSFLDHFQLELAQAIKKDAKKWDKQNSKTTNELGQKLLRSSMDFQRIKTFYQERMHWMQKKITQWDCIHPSAIMNELEQQKEIPPNIKSKTFEINVPKEIFDTQYPETERYRYTPSYFYHVINHRGVVIADGPVSSSKLSIPYETWTSGVYYIDISDSWEEFGVPMPATSAAYESFSALYKLVVP